MRRVAAPPPAAEWADPGSLVPWPGNPRDNAAAVGQVAASIRRFGFGAPIVARRETREVISGHTRLAAAVELGLEAVPVRFLDLSEPEAHALALADNRLHEVATWDDARLAAALAALGSLDVDLSGLGWDDAALADLMSVAADRAPGGAVSDAGPVLGQFVYSVVVTTAGEAAQAELIKRLEAEGFTCRPLIS